MPYFIVICVTDDSSVKQFSHQTALMHGTECTVHIVYIEVIEHIPRVMKINKQGLN